MFYFSTPLNVSFAHTKGDKRTLNCESLIIIIILLTYIRYICKLHSSSNKERDTERTYFFSQHKRPLSTPKQNCKMQFFLLSNTSMFTFSLFPSLSLSLCSFLNFAHFERKHIRTCALLHARTHTHKHVRSSLPRSHSLSDMKLSLGDVKRQQRERKYKCSANGFCGDVTVAASVGDRWKR